MKETLNSLFLDYWKNVLIVVLAFLLYKSCNRSEIPNSLANVIVPETKGSFVPRKPIQVPVAIPSSRPQEKGNTVFVENVIDAKLLAENINLQVDFAKANDSIRKLLYAKTSQLSKFSTTFENDKLILNIDGIVQGEVKEITPSYIWKKQAVEVPIKTKETVLRLLGGLEIGNNINLSNPIFKANLGVQNRKGNVITGSYDSNKNIYVGYQFSIFNIRR